jgi:uncharacterized protein YndB with AHSA1/START domain
MGTTAQGIQLEIRRTYPVPPAAVFSAWTDAEALGRWFAPSPDVTTIVHVLEARVGGRYRIEMRPPTGPTYIVGGVYRILDAPRCLAFTWSWEGATVEEESLVVIELRPLDAGTELVLTHSRFASEASRDGHARGWGASLPRLATYLTTD